MTEEIASLSQEIAENKSEKGEVLVKRITDLESNLLLLQEENHQLRIETVANYEYLSLSISNHKVN